MVNSLPTEKHEDERRVLVEWIKDFPVRSSKVLVAKGNCLVGQHYHKLKDEVFYLLQGHGRVTLPTGTEDMKEGDVVYIPAESVHSFWLEKGSILLGAGTKPYDPTDDYND